MFARTRVALAIILCRGTNCFVVRQSVMRELEETTALFADQLQHSGKAPRPLVRHAGTLQALVQWACTRPLIPIPKDK